jgi:hypothetical protein
MKDDVEFLHKAMHAYVNVQCNTVAEFNEDLNRIAVIRKMLTRYEANGEISVRLILNHAVILFNVFGPTALDMILYKTPDSQYPVLFPFLLFLHRLPLDVQSKYDIELDETIIKEIGRI